MTVTYEVTEEVYCSGDSNRTSCGIAAYTSDEGIVSQAAAVHDITSDRQALAGLVEKCNRLQLSLVHLNDIVEDFLAC